MKYVMLKQKLGKDIYRFEPIIFSKMLIHAEVAETMIEMLKPEVFEVHSAGFYEAGKCVGESSSLKIKSDPQDGQRILMADYGGLLG